MRHLAVGCQNDQPAWMSVLFDAGVIGILKTYAGGKVGNGILTTGQKMPVAGAIPSIAMHIRRLLFRGEGGGFIRVDAYKYQVKLPSGLPRHVAEALSGAVEYQSTEHRTTVISQDEHRWFIAKIIAQMHNFSGFIFKGQTRRHLRANFLVELDP